MQKFHRIWTVVLAMLLLAGLFACGRSGSASGANAEALDFELTADGIPAGWYMNSYEGGYRILTENGARKKQLENDPETPAAETPAAPASDAVRNKRPARGGAAPAEAAKA